MTEDTADKPKTRRRPAPARRPLYLAGRNIFAERGYHGTTVDAIVEAAGLAKGAFYHHWPSKDLLLHEIMDNVMTVQTELAVQAATTWEGPSDEVLSRFIQELFGLVIRNLKEAKIFHAEVSMLETREFADVRHKAEELHHSIQAIVRRGIESGRLRDVESVDLVGWVISGALSYAYRWWPLEEPMSPEQVGSLLSGMLLGGLASGRRH